MAIRMAENRKVGRQDGQIGETAACVTSVMRWPSWLHAGRWPMALLVIAGRRDGHHFRPEKEKYGRQGGRRKETGGE
jgi:hypothetical protein